MPIYEYVCQKCGRELEVMQKMSDKPLTKCTACKGKLEKVFSQTSFHLKGSGWYATDYNKSGKAEKTEKKDEKKTEKDGKKDAAAPAGSACAATGGGCATGMCE